MQSHVIALIGPSGAGKSTIARELAKAPNITFVKSYTTRQKRFGEDDDSHLFVTNKEFEAMNQQGAYIGILTIFNQKYALPKLPQDSTILILLRAPAIKRLKELYPYSVVIQLEAPLEVLEKRLQNRGSLERTDRSILKQEIESGKKLANIVIDTNKPLENTLNEARKYIATTTQ